MNMYLNILDKVLNDLRLVMPDLETNNIDELATIIQLSELSNEILSCFIEFFECEPAKDTVNNYAIVMQQLKSRLIDNQRAVKTLEEFEDELYFEQENDDEKKEDEESE